MPPPGRYASASNEAGVDSSVSSLLTYPFLFNGDSMMPVLRVEALVRPVRAIGGCASTGLLFASLNSSMAVADPCG